MSSRVTRFIAYYRPYWRLLLADTACALLLAGVTLLLPLVARAITDTALSGADPDPLRAIAGYAALMLALLAVGTACSVFIDFHGHMMGARMEADMRADLFAHYQNLSHRFYDEQRTGSLMSRITTDLFAIGELAHHGPEDLAIAVFKFAGAFVILLAIDIPLTLVLFFFLPIMAAYALVFYRIMTRANRRSAERIADINAQVEDTLSGIRVVRSFANESVEREKFARENARFLDSRRDGYRAEAWFSGGLVTFTEMLTLAIVVFGAIALLDGRITAPDLVTFLLCAAILIDPIRRAVNLVRLLQEGMTGFVRFQEVMAIAPDITDAPDAIDLPSPVRGAIRLDSVTFRYREGGDAVLSGVSLDIAPGDTVALIGPSGVGKTTLCSLIPRFYDVTDGAIEVDGIDVRRLTLRSLRVAVGVVQQDVYLFAGTVADNIGYGRPGAPREAIIAAAQQAAAHEFIMRLPDGYDTDIGQRGVKLSGGQKQRLSIARVFLKDPPILILDEATSALDNESERLVQHALERLARGRTTLVIAHRLTTIRNAPRIVVLNEDGIAEQGTHDDLIARSGAYARLYAMGEMSGEI